MIKTATNQTGDNEMEKATALEIDAAEDTIYFFNKLVSLKSLNPKPPTREIIKSHIKAYNELGHPINEARVLKMIEEKVTFTI